jgi:prepilin-type N-terminal cleavage/methylation domain-containing protein
MASAHNTGLVGGVHVNPQRSAVLGGWGPSAGFSLLEVIVSMAILAIAVVGTGSAVMISTHLNTRANHEALAQAAAESKVAEIRETGFGAILGTFSGQTFAVPGLPSPTGIVDQGEVIIINSETPDEATYGRNLGVPGGGPGVDLDGNGRFNDILSGAAFAMDMDGDGVQNTATVLPANFKLIPVAVLVRWRSSEGIQHLQVVTAVVNRSP